MSQTLTTSLLSVAIDGHFAAAQTRDGGWLVTVPPEGAYVTSFQSSAGLSDACLNVRGGNMLSPPPEIRLPQPVRPGDALVVLARGSGRGDYWSPPGSSRNVEAMPVVFVPYAAGPGLLRPPAIGDGYAPRLYRQAPIPESAIRLGRLPRIVDVDRLGVDWSAWGAGKPDIPYLTKLLGRFCGELWSGWGTADKTPDRQHPGYGSYLAAVVSQAMVQLCSTASDEAKLPLALAVAQWGIDLVGAFADSRRHDLGGGHCAGRLPLVIMAGHLLGIEEMANARFLVPGTFQEDLAYVRGEWWFPGWDARWRFQLGGISDGSLCVSPPSTWGDPNSPTHSTWAWCFKYITQVVGAQVGTALAMQLMGREDAIGRPMVRMVQQFMQGPPADARAQLVDAGLSIPWGTDYSLDRGAGFCAAAWRRYAR